MDSIARFEIFILRLVIQVEGNLAGAGDALMLDCDGFVSETNATNIVSVDVYFVTFYVFTLRCLSI